MELKPSSAPVQNQTKKGWFEIDGKRMYLKSDWERKYALYLDYMKKHGHIMDWEYEPETFWFDKIKRGTNNYKPDFRVLFPTGNYEYIEVKGHTTSKDLTKWKRMKKYHPHINLRVIDGSWFKIVNKQLKNLINQW
jgi:hypothetical protein